MTGKRFAKAAAVAALAFSVLFSAQGAVLPASATSLSELQQKQAELKQKSAELDARLSQLKNDETKQAEYKDALDAKSLTLEKQIDSKNDEIKQLDADILKKESAIAGKQQQIDADFVKLKQRVYALYLTGEASNLEVVLNAKSIMDLADKTEILRVISKHDTGLMDDLKNDIGSIKTEKAAIEKSRKAVNEARTALEKDEAQLRTLAGEAAKVLASLQKNRQQAESEQAQNRIDQNAAQTAVDSWLADYYEAQRKAAQQNSDSGDSGSSAQPLPADRVECLAAVAKQYLGCPYLWGGSAPPSFDCSGYVSWVVNHSGWNVGRRGVDGLSAICTTVSRSEARPGDLVFYDYTYGGLPNSHVGIYLGNNIAIQCDDPGVEYVNITDSYWARHFGSFGRLP